MKTLFLASVFSIYLYAYSSNVINAYAVSVYDKNMVEENVQAKRKTDKDYNGTCYSKIYIFGKYFHENPTVKIGNSRGHIIKTTSIKKNGLIIGKSIIFKHYAVSKGYLEVRFGQKLFDSKVFVK